MEHLFWVGIGALAILGALWYVIKSEEHDE